MAFTCHLVLNLEDFELVSEAVVSLRDTEADNLIFDSGNEHIVDPDSKLGKLCDLCDRLLQARPVGY